MPSGTNGLSSVLDSPGHQTTGETVTNMQLSEKRKLLEGPNSIKFLQKSDISGLCEILHFPVGSQYSLNYHLLKYALFLLKL